MVQLVHEETPTSWRIRMRYSVHIRRPEFLSSTVATILVAGFLSAHSWTDLVSLPFLAAAVLVIQGEQICNMVNCLADREQDLAHKSRQATAVFGLGETRVRREINATIVLCVVLGMYLMFTTRHWDLVGIGLVALFFGTQYSLPPLRLKGRGIWQIPVLNITLTIVPGLIVIRSLPYPIEWFTLVAIFGMGLTLNGVMVAKTAEDIPEDEQFGVLTSVRALGLTRAFVLGTVLVGLGAGLVTWAVLELGGFSWALLPYGLGVGIALAVNASILRRVIGKPVADGVDVVRSYTKYLPYYAPILAWSTVVPAVYVLISR
ncbi:prenyltransferase [Mycobacterium sp. NPDC050853]|uniref:prenyltransferase n=1 Tax=Mycobacterium sp. NPDC050853 TaxID=3155160 RepID=UPI0033F7F1B9